MNFGTGPASLAVDLGPQLVAPPLAERGVVGRIPAQTTHNPAFGEEGLGARGVVVIGSDPARPGLTTTGGAVTSATEPGAVVVLTDLTLAAGEALLVRLENAL